jgi:gentisate 1,2-dioxygenase
MSVSAPAAAMPSSTTSLVHEDGDEAVFYVPTNSFSYKQPEVPCHFFDREREEILQKPRVTRTLDLSLSEEMGLTYPATTPNLLVRYISIAPSDSLVTQFKASAEIYCVLEGEGTSTAGGKTINWRAGDVFVFPGGQKTRHVAGLDGALLYEATDEPVLSFSGTRPSEVDNSASVLHYAADKIGEQIDRAYARSENDEEVAKSVFFTSRKMELTRTTTPWIATNINTLDPAKDQRAHRHNAAAITLSLQGEGVHSLVDGQQIDWKPFGVMVTPPTALHSHHNRGTQRMSSFVVQDSGIYYYSRTTGFSFDQAGE